MITYQNILLLFVLYAGYRLIGGTFEYMRTTLTVHHLLIAGCGGLLVASYWSTVVAIKNSLFDMLHNQIYTWESIAFVGALLFMFIFYETTRSLYQSRVTAGLFTSGLFVAVFVWYIFDVLLNGGNHVA